MILPIVTGIRFLNRNEPQLRFARAVATPAGVVPSAGAAAVNTAAWLFRNIANGMKYILAMLCSNPQATNAVTGNTMENILLTPSLVALANQTARQTSQLQRIPRLPGPRSMSN